MPIATADADDEMDDAEPTEADVEALAALNAKLFGALEKLATRNQLCCSYRGLTDSDLLLAWRALRNGSVAGSVTTIVRLDLSSNYLTSSSAETLGELLGHAGIQACRVRVFRGFFRIGSHPRPRCHHDLRVPSRENYIDWGRGHGDVCA